MATTYHDPTKWLAWALQARTDDAEQAVDDASGEDARTLLDFYTQGVVSGLEVSERGAGANMSVDVTVGSAVVEGVNVDQGKYLAKLAGATAFNVAIGAADVSNPRIDEVYLVVLDDGYDSTDFVLPRLAVRDGTPAGSPSAPGPDGAWDAYLLLATIQVAASENAIETGHIADERDFTELAIASGGSTPTGALLPFAGASAPDGYLLCNGSAVSRSTYARLFAVIGTVWGAGDTSTTFNVPDMRGRYPRGVAASGTGNALGASFGADTVDPPATTSGNNSGTSFDAQSRIDDPTPNPVARSPHTHSTNIAPFESFPSSRAVNYIIKT